MKQVLTSLENQQTSQAPLRPDVLWKMPPSPPYRLVQSIPGPNITSSLTLEVDGSIQVIFNNLGNAASLAAVFDRYRIIKAKISFLPTVSESSSLMNGPLFTAIDYDDSAATSVTSLVQYDTLKIAPVGTYFERIFVPRFALAAYSGVFTSFAESMIGQWIDVASPSVIYYGLKYALPSGGAALTLWSTIVTYEIEFMNVR
jgi:hypothetical protein